MSDVRGIISDIKSDLEYELSDEEDILDNMENFSGTERYAAIEDAVNNMSDAVNSIEEAVDNIDSAMEFISSARD